MTARHRQCQFMTRGFSTNCVPPTRLCRGAPYSLKVHQLELMGVAETSARVLDGGYAAVTLDTYSHAAPGLTVPSVHRERK